MKNLLCRNLKINNEIFITNVIVLWPGIQLDWVFMDYSS